MLVVTNLHTFGTTTVVDIAATATVDLILVLGGVLEARRLRFSNEGDAVIVPDLCVYRVRYGFFEPLALLLYDLFFEEAAYLLLAFIARFVLALDENEWTDTVSVHEVGFVFVLPALLTGRHVADRDPLATLGHSIFLFLAACHIS